MSFKQIRIAFLVIILVLVVHHHFNDRARIASWEVPLFIAVYPINADGSNAAEGYLGRLRERDFDDVAGFMRREAARWEVGIDRPVYVELGEPIENSPPAPPIGGSYFDRAGWIARMRWWRWRFDNQGMDPDVIVLARYFDPAQSRHLPHSTGIEQIRIAIANLFATKAMEGENSVVLMHEILHTLGASDKYDLESGLPLYPAGYARPERVPLYPQQTAEIMAGRIPVSENRALQARDLTRVIVGPATAAEIGWRDGDGPE